MAYLPSKQQIEAYKNKQKIDLSLSRIIPPADEFKRAEMYREAARIEKNVNSWSQWDLKKAYEDSLECIELLEEEVDGPAFDVLQRIKLNLKVFESEKA